MGASHRVPEVKLYTILLGRRPVSYPIRPAFSPSLSPNSLVHFIKVSKGPLLVGFGSAYVSQRSETAWFRNGKDITRNCFRNHGSIEGLVLPTAQLESHACIILISQS